MDLREGPVHPLAVGQVHMALNGITRRQSLAVSGVDDKHGDLDTLLNTLGSAHETEFIVR